MATSIEDLRAIVVAQRDWGRNYMMMETAVYTRPFLHAKSLSDGGEFGRIQFLRGAHYQDMECWPPYWSGLPPMWYATHAVGPSGAT
jgi:predicted dehydrogenase